MRSYPIWVDTYNNAYSNNGAKSQGVRKWKQEEADKAEAFRNERYAERLRVNGYRD